MEQQHYQQHHEDSSNNNTGSGGGSGASKSSFLCRQSSTRWIPTTDQIRILKDLYYNCGVRSPNAEQIQRISARLRQYGKIEGKNVFYWFQNHKARERQKKRLTVDISSNKFPNTMSPGVSPTSSAVYGLGQMGSSGGPLFMERSYKESSLTGAVGGVEGNMGWVGVETAKVPPFYYQQQRPAAYYYEDNYYYNHNPHQQQELKEGDQEADMGVAASAELETLPLFPIHSQQQEQEQYHWAAQGRENNVYFHAHYLGQHGENDLHHPHYNHLYNNSSSIDTSLELTLNSYYAPHGS